MPHSVWAQFSLKVVVYSQKKEGASVSNSFALELEKAVRAALVTINSVTVFASATTAFNAIRKGVQIGHDIEGMAKDLSR